MSEELLDKNRLDELYRLVFDLAPRRFLVFREEETGDWRLVIANQAFLKLFDGVDLVPLVGTTSIIGLTFQQVTRRLFDLPDDMVEQSMRYLQEAIRTQQSQSYEIHCKTRFGETHSEVMIQILPVPDLVSRYAVVRTHDVSDQLTVRRERDRLVDQLYQSRQMESLGTFASGIAHDFNNLLMSILGNTELLLINASSATLVEHAAADIKLAVFRARDMIRQIRAFSRRDLPVRRPVSLGNLLNEVVLLVQPALPPDITISFENPPTESVTLADAIQLHQVFFNLCTNAVQALGAGPGSVIIKIEHQTLPTGEVSLHQLPPGNYWKVEVIDNGVGMTEEIKKRAFEPFFTTKRDAGGTGLGLAAAHGIVHSHGGWIEIESTPGDGATLRVLLPDVGAGELEIQRRKLVSPGMGQEILVLDDDHHVTRLVANTLHQLGYRSVGLSDPQEALRLIAENPHRFAMAIVDWAMPKLSGREFARKVKENCDMPMLLMTGQLDKHDDRSGATADFEAVLGKPFTIQELAEHVASILAP